MKKYKSLKQTKLYKSASKKSKVIMKIKKGKSIKFIKKKGKFYKIKFKKKTGFIPINSVKVSGLWVANTKKRVNALSKPGKKFKKLATLKKSEKIWIDLQKGFWCRVYEKSYWVHINGLKGQ